MWKWLSWALRILATAVLLSFLSIWTTGYIVNSYMETLLKQLNLPLETQPFALSGVWGKLWGADSPPAKEEAQAAVPSSPPVRSRPAEGQPSDSGGGEATPGPGGGQAEPAPGPRPDLPDSESDLDAGIPANPETREDGSVPVMGGQGGIMDMTEQQRETLRLVMSKLNGEQLSELSGYLEGGLTEEELAAVGTLVQPSLSTEEYMEFMELLELRTVSTESSETSPAPTEQPSE